MVNVSYCVIGVMLEYQSPAQPEFLIPDMEQSPQQLRGSPRKHTIRPDKLPTEQEKMAEPITREQAHDNAPLGAERFSGQDIHRRRFRQRNLLLWIQGAQQSPVGPFQVLVGSVSPTKREQ
jgi:hypothetical protein